MVKWPNVPKVIKEQTGLAMVIVANYQKRKIKLREIPHFQLRKKKEVLMKLICFRKEELCHLPDKILIFFHKALSCKSKLDSLTLFRLKLGM